MAFYFNLFFSPHNTLCMILVIFCFLVYAPAWWFCFDMVCYFFVVVVNLLASGVLSCCKHNYVCLRMVLHKDFVSLFFSSLFFLFLNRKDNNLEICTENCVLAIFSCLSVYMLVGIGLLLLSS